MVPHSGLRDLESNTWMEDSKLVRHRTMVVLILVAVVLCLLVILLPSVDRIITDPDARWAVLVLVVVAVGILVLREAAKAETSSSPMRPESEKATSRGRLERLSVSIRGGRHGSGYSQMLAVMELRSALRGKVMSLRGLSREDYNLLATDERALRRLVGDHELCSLLVMDLRAAFDASGGMEGKGFMEYIDRMVGKMEEWT